MAHPTYHLWCIGCQMNEADALRAASLLERAGYRPSPRPDDADFHLLATCVIRQQAEDKIHLRLRQLAGIRRRRRITVALLGCFVGRTPAQRDAILAAYPFVDLLLSPSDLAPLESYLAAHPLPLECAPGDAPDGPASPGPTTLPPESPDPIALDPAAPLFPPSLPVPVTAHLPVVLGCSHACTYCIVPYRRGPERSRPSALVLDEARRLVASGVREITLLGQIVDRYGLDRPGEILLPELLRRVAAIPGLLRLRFLTSHPSWFTDELVRTVAASTVVCPHFEIPVQSGSDSVLAAMRRGYAADDFRALVSRIRSAIPGAGISTDIIVGFPGETPADFDATLALIRDTAPDMVRIAKYSPRPQTWSARHLPDSVPEPEKERRRAALDSLLRAILEEKHAALLGTTATVLVESVDPAPGRRHGRRRGRTPDHKLVFVENTDAPPGTLLPVRIAWTGPYSLLASPA